MCLEFRCVLFRSFVYILSNQDIDTNSKSYINLLEVHSLETKNLYEAEGIITEIVFDPKDEQQLFFLKASTFENYSPIARSEEHTSELQSRGHLVCRLLLEKKKKTE